MLKTLRSGLADQDHWRGRCDPTIEILTADRADDYPHCTHNHVIFQRRPDLQGSSGCDGAWSSMECHLRCTKYLYPCDAVDACEARLSSRRSIDAVLQDGLLVVAGQWS